MTAIIENISVFYTRKSNFSRLFDKSLLVQGVQFCNLTHKARIATVPSTTIVTSNYTNSNNAASNLSDISLVAGLPMLPLWV